MRNSVTWNLIRYLEVVTETLYPTRAGVLALKPTLHYCRKKVAPIYCVIDADIARQEEKTWLETPVLNSQVDMYFENIGFI